jgi:hypothetical protein
VGCLVGWPVGLVADANERVVVVFVEGVHGEMSTSQHAASNNTRIADRDIFVYCCRRFFICIMVKKERTHGWRLLCDL